MGVTGDDEHPKKTRRQRLVSLAIQVALLVFIFAILLPLFVDYDAVFDAIKGLSWWQFLVLLTLALVRVPTEALIYRALLPGLNLRVGTEAYLSQNFIGTFTPPPMPSLVQYAYFRSDGFDQQTSLTGAIGTFIFPSGGRLVLPLAAVLLVLIAGVATTAALIMGLISLAVLALLSVIIWLIARSDRSARRLGDFTGRLISWGLAKFKRDPITGLGDNLVEFRDNTFEVVRQRWRPGAVAVAVNLFFSYLILLAAVRFVGLSSGDISWEHIFAVFAVAFFAGVVIPITGSGLGVVDVVMIAALSAFTGNADVSAAAAMLWRVFYSFITIPFGVYTSRKFQRENPDYMKDATSAFGSKDGEESARNGRESPVSPAT